ncbi:MAG TPA: hypothetical protein VGL99_12865 [Chloroflexota bacterium]|jgi:hypothetical protein
MIDGRHLHAAVALSAGKVLVVGGESYQNGQDVDLASAELYSPS